MQKEKKKRGRPAKGRSEANRHLSFEIAGAYTACRQQGMSHEDALDELSKREWRVHGNKFLGVEAIKAAINESRDCGISEDDFEHSVRLQKVNPHWKDVFTIDPETGKVLPK